MFCSQNLEGVLNVAFSLRGGTCPFRNFRGGQGFVAFGREFEGPPLPSMGVFDTFPQLIKNTILLNPIPTSPIVIHFKYRTLFQKMSWPGFSTVFIEFY